MRPFAVAGVLLLCLCSRAFGQQLPGAFAMDFDPHARLRFGGLVGRRIEANARYWLVRAPAANPGLLEMFRLRDRQPEPALVPWAGEFVGKYLISAIQALRMTDNAELEETVRTVVGQLIASRAGYQLHPELGTDPSVYYLPG